MGIVAKAKSRREESWSPISKPIGPQPCVYGAWWMLWLCDLWDDLPLSEPQVSHPIQRRLVSRGSETGPVFALDSMMAGDPSSLDGLWVYKNKAVQLATKTFITLSVSTCSLYTFRWARSQGTKAVQLPLWEPSSLTFTCTTACHSTHQNAPIFHYKCNYFALK